MGDHINATRNNNKKTKRNKRMHKAKKVRRSFNSRLRLCANFVWIRIQWIFITKTTHLGLWKCAQMRIQKKRVGTQVYLVQKHKQIQKSYDPECVYCPEIPKGLGSLNRHIWYLPPRSASPCPYIATMITWGRFPACHLWKYIKLLY